MTDEPSSDLLGALPRTRPHRRSEKRPARNASPAAEKPSPTRTTPAGSAATAGRAKAASRAKTSSRAKAASRAKATAPGKPAPRAKAATPGKASATRTKAPPPTRKPAPATGVAVIGTAVQAAAEIAEIGLTLSRKAVRNAIGRLPRP